MYLYYVFPSSFYHSVGVGTKGGTIRKGAVRFETLSSGPDLVVAQMWKSFGVYWFRVLTDSLLIRMTGSNTTCVPESRPATTVFSTQSYHLCLQRQIVIFPF